MSDYSSRRSAVLSSLPADADALLVTARENVRYLTGFTGTNGWLFLSPESCVFLTDPRYAEQAHAQIADARIEIARDGLDGGLGRAFRDSRVRCVGFESRHVTVALHGKLVAAADVRWAACDRLVEAVRRRKDAHEVDAVRRALALTEEALVEVAGAITPGQTETGVAAALEYACRRRGAEGMAFETIVASGERSALPHGVATDRVIAADEPVMIDMGCRLAGYCSDITRMVWCGASPDPRWREIYDVVNAARDAALNTLAAGIEAEAVDAAARGGIASAGWGDAFRHGTGHGVGLEIHEAPTLSPRGADRLEAGMVVTIEPAIYVEGEFGIRIEDMALVAPSGAERLTTLNTEPILPKAP